MASFAQLKQSAVTCATKISGFFNDSVRQTMLSNGVRIASQPKLMDKKLRFCVTIGSGSFDDPIGKEGAAHFLEHVFYRGGLAEEMSARGGSINASTWPQQIQINGYVDNNSENAEFLINEIANILVGTIDPEDYERERKRILNEIGRSLDNSGRVLWNKTIGVFSDCKTPANTLGSYESFKSLSIDDLEEYKSKTFTGDNVVIALTGINQHGWLHSQLENKLKEMISHKEKTRRVLHFEAGDHRFENESINQLYFAFAFPAVASEQKDDCRIGLAVRYINEKLGSRILNELGSVYAIGSCALTFRDEFGVFYISGDMLPESADEISQEIAKILAEAAYKIDDNVFTRVQGHALDYDNYKRSMLWFSTHDDEELSNGLIEFQGVQTQFQKDHDVTSITANELQQFFVELLTHKPAVISYGNAENLHTATEFEEMLIHECKYAAEMQPIVDPAPS